MERMRIVQVQTQYHPFCAILKVFFGSDLLVGDIKRVLMY